MVGIIKTSWCSMGWTESGKLCMFVYAIAGGVNEGWLEASFTSDAQRGWIVLCKKALDDGIIIDTCPSTHRSDDLQYYLDRSRSVDNPHAYGPFLLAGSEILKMSKL